MKIFLKDYFIFIKLIMIYFLFSLLSLNCKDTNPIEVMEFSISGKLNPFYPVSDLSNYIISINGPAVKKDTTNSAGEFTFENVIEGEYELSISDTLGPLGDTIITIYPDQIISLKLKDFWSNYLPLKVGNKWVYNFKYYPTAYEYLIYKEGKITWTIKNKLNDNEFIIQEIAEGIQHSYTYDSTLNPIPIITNFGPDTLETTFEIAEYIWVKIKLSFFRLESGSVFVKRYYPNYSGNSLGLKNYDFRYYFIYDQIKGALNFHNITLQKDVGIKYWHYGGSHNGAPQLTLNIIDYEIK